jgi:hypothetical protein
MVAALLALVALPAGLGTDALVPLMGVAGALSLIRARRAVRARWACRAADPSRSAATTLGRDERGAR